MKEPQEGKLLRIFIGEADKWQGHSLYEAIVSAARDEGLAGATVTKGIMGYGGKSPMHTTRFLRISEDLPIIIEIIDSEEKIKNFLPKLDPLVREGLATLENVQVLWYRANNEA